MISRRQAMQALASIAVASKLRADTDSDSRDTQAGTQPGDVVRQARQLTDKLMSEVENNSETYSLEKSDVYTADVEISAEKFSRQVRYCSNFDLPVWSAQFGDTVPAPVDWNVASNRFSLEATERLDPFFQAIFREYSRLSDSSATEMGFKLVPVSPSDAKQNFATALFAFLTSRFAAPRALSASPGLQFRVYSHASKMRVRYTCAYFPDLSDPLVFGAPTSPVDGWIQPGIWRFGLDGPGVRLKFDSGKFAVPPLAEARLNI